MPRRGDGSSGGLGTDECQFTLHPGHEATRPRTFRRTGRQPRNNDKIRAADPRLSGAILDRCRSIGRCVMMRLSVRVAPEPALPWSALTDRARRL